MRLPALALAALLAGCAPGASAPSAPVLFVFRVDAPAFMEIDAQLEVKRQIPLGLPEGCGLGSVFPAPRGPLVAIELSCAFGQAVVWLNTDTSEIEQPITTSDSHFLAWAPRGEAVYLRIDSINRPRIVRRSLDGRQEQVLVDASTYDLSPGPSGEDFVFAFSQGMGLGSEMWSARGRGATPEQIAVDGANYLSLARWSPDGRQIAFIKVPDSATPFAVGELWVMQADGTRARMLAQADSGHGFPPAWAPDGMRIAFVARENPQEASADSSAAALISNLYMASLEGGALVPITDFQAARVEAPAWRPDGEAIAFAAVVDDRMAVFVKNLMSGDMQRVQIDWICCAGWLRR